MDLMAVPTFVGFGTAVGAIGAITPTIHASTTTNDIMLLYVERSGDQASGGPGGSWVAVATPTNGDANGSTFDVYWKRHTGSETDPLVPDTGNHQYAVILSFRGCVATGDPWDSAALASSTLAAATAVVVPGGTTSLADCLVVVGVTRANDASGVDFSGEANADLATVAELFDGGTAAGNGGGIVVISGGKATAGTFGDTTTTAATSTARCYSVIPLTATAAGGTQNLTGTLFTKAPTFNTGVVSSVRNLTGSLFTKAPTFNTGTITATRTLTGVLFQKAPTFPIGAVSLASSPQTVNGVLFTKTPTFPQGAVTSTYALTGTLFTKAPTFSTGTVTTGGVTLTGVLFVKAPTFPQGVITTGSVVLTGVLFQSTPTFPTGTVTAGTVTLTGVLFQTAPTFPTGTIGQAGTLFGTLFQNTPVFFTGTIAQGAPSFWTPNPAGYTTNPVAFVRVGRVGPSPWGIQLSGHRFEKAPSFPTGTVT